MEREISRIEQGSELRKREEWILNQEGEDIKKGRKEKWRYSQKFSEEEADRNVSGSYRVQR